MRVKLSNSMWSVAVSRYEEAVSKLWREFAIEMHVAGKRFMT
jgi:hypothetical protein